MLENLAANWPYLILMGIAGGFTSALLGIGGGVIIVPMLVIIACAPQHQAQGLCLGYMVLTTLAGFFFYKYRFDIHLDFKVVALLTAGGVLGSFLGALLASHISPFWLRKMFAALMIIVAVRFLIERPSSQTEASEPAQQPAAAAASTPQTSPEAQR